MLQYKKRRTFAYRKGGIVRKCDACGKTYAESKDVFCPHCGAIGQKRCTHGSSFDSSKWDRGEIYKNDSNTYEYGSEPHAQRAGNAYSTHTEKSREVKKQFGDDYKTPKSAIATIFEAITKYFNANKNDEKKIVKIISAVFAIIAMLNVFIVGISELGFDNSVDTFYEEESVDYIDWGSEYPVDVTAGEAYVEPFEDWDGTWFFDLYIEKLYMSSNEEEMTVEVCNKLSGDDYVYLDGVFCTMPDKIMSFERYNNIVSKDGIYVASDAQSTDAHTIQYWFESGEIIYCSYLTFSFDDGSMVNLTLPFDAFSCDEEGNVTYYTCNINEEESRVTFEETEPVVVLEEVECVVEF